MSKENMHYEVVKTKVVLDSLKAQLENAINDATKYLDEAYKNQASNEHDDIEIYEGRLELAQELLEYLEEKIC